MLAFFLAYLLALMFSGPIFWHSFWHSQLAVLMSSHLAKVLQTDMFEVLKEAVHKKPESSSGSQLSLSKQFLSWFRSARLVNPIPQAPKDVSAPLPTCMLQHGTHVVPRVPPGFKTLDSAPLCAQGYIATDWKLECLGHFQFFWIRVRTRVGFRRRIDSLKAFECQFFCKKKV